MDNQLPSPNAPGPERQPGGAPESLPVTPGPAAEAAPSGSPAQGAPATSPLTQKLSATDVAKVIAATPPVGSGTVVGAPEVAGDVDVIEPEWVDKAEKVVEEHAGDPYGEEEAIEDLQRDYMQKRYGISVGEADPADDKPKGT
jgi:hypothetical protein